MHGAKGRGETSKVKSVLIVSTGVLEKHGVTNDKEVKEESNAFSRSVKGALSTKLDKGKEKTHNHHRG